MKKSIQTTHHLEAPLEKVWPLIKSGTDWENWFPILTGSRVEGNNRFCNLDNGDVLEESFLASEAEKTFMYSVNKQQTFPANNIVAIMRLEALDAHHTRLNWSIDMDVETEETFAIMQENVGQLYQAATQELQALASA
jgi:carbon monoxide dehydrogenase subunit G